MKIVNGFVFKLLSKEQALVLFELKNFELYVLHEDGTESLISNRRCLREAFEIGCQVGIEVGNVNNHFYKEKLVEHLNNLSLKKLASDCSYILSLDFEKTEYRVKQEDLRNNLIESLSTYILNSKDCKIYFNEVGFKA